SGRSAGGETRTAGPPGGPILKDKNGSPIGLMNEHAQVLVEQALNTYRSHRPAGEAEAEAQQQVDLAVRESLSKGITTFEDAGSPLATVDLLKPLAKENKLGLRVWMMLRQSNDVLAPNLKKYYMIGVGNDHLTVRAIKRQI